MRRSLRLLATLLLLLPVGTTLSFRAALRHRSPPSSPLNSTLLRLSALDPAESEIQKDVSDLLSATATTAYPPNTTNFSVITLWRPASVPGRSRFRIPIRIRAPKNLQILPPFRLALTNWLRNRRILHPSIMSELLLLIKRPIDLQFGYPDTRQRYASCAVVGNSGILLQSEHGEFIDGHDIVIRLNNARIAGYERHVGYRTSVSFINSNILHLCARREGCGCHPYGDFVPIVVYVCQPAHFLDYLACNCSHSAPLLVTDPRLDALCGGIAKYYSMKRFVEETGRRPEEWGKARDERTFHYSSGMQAVVLALGICEQVSVFGFGKLVGARHHYHTNQKAELALHDYEAEYAFYHELVERPQVVPFLKDSKFKVPPVVFYG